MVNLNPPETENATDVTPYHTHTMIGSHHHSFPVVDQAIYNHIRQTTNHKYTPP